MKTLYKILKRYRGTVSARKGIGERIYKYKCTT